MVRLILFLTGVVVLAAGLAWLADRPGLLVVTWEGYEVETSVFRAVVIFAALVGLAVFAWSILTQLWHSPAAIGSFFMRRRQKRGLEAVSAGMIAIGAGDRAAATRYAIQARKSLPNEPLTHLLRAQTAQLSGDKTTARRIFEAMLGSPDTEQLGLRGLFLEAQREGETEAAQQFAARALRLNPKLGWPVEALFDLQCKQSDWVGALETLSIARRYHHVEKASADRRRAVLLTAKAQQAEEGNPEAALTLALEAHALAPDLVPASVIAGRLLASKGNTARAAKILQKTWARAPHPDLATTYAYARIGDSPRDRLDRVKQLAALSQHSLESPIAVANAAIEAHSFDEARNALEPLLDGRLTQRVCLLMARVEGEQHGDKGRVREWLARAVNAPRDPAWTADGVVSDHWAPVSPVTGALDAFRWRVPVEPLEKSEGELLARKLDELVALGAPSPAATVITADAPPASGGSAVADGKASQSPSIPETPKRTDAVDVDVVSEIPRPQAPEATPAKAGESVATELVATGGRSGAGGGASSPRDTTGAAKKPRAAAASKPPTTEEVPSVAEPAAGKQAGAKKVPPTRPNPVSVPAQARTEPPLAQKSKDVPPVEPRIFISPRAPDDPGPDTSDGEEASTPLSALRATS